MKKIFALILFMLLLISCGVATFAADTQPTAALYSYYGNNMLFKQNDAAVIAGTATPGSNITCTLRNSANETIAFSQAVTSADGTFTVSFMAPAGSFEEYTITLQENSVTFAELSGVVFGELWLAGGQSNMHWTLIGTGEGYDMALTNQKGNSAIRMLYTPHPGAYKGDLNKIPATPLTDYETAPMWCKGDDPSIFGMTAIGYFFAESMLKDLNVPVGIIDANLGGTSILTWLPREAIENNAEILADCQSDNRYIPLAQWNESTANAGIDMTANFNKIIAPLRNFRLSGMIWYQGEGDVYWAYGRYMRAFNAMQQAYTKHFNHNGPLPIVFTQLASYSYGFGLLDFLQTKNVEFAAIQQQDPSSRALTSILDVNLDYTMETQSIHPYYKKPVAEKMAYAAKGLVYGLYDSYTAATPKKVEIKNSSVYVTLRDVGDTLLVDGDTLNAFSVCSANGVYVSAKAELVSKDTVRVYSPNVLNPAGAAYACAQSNQNANLYASRNGKKLLAVSPFITNINLRAHLWQNDWWTTCDYETFWHCHYLDSAGYFPSWESEGGNISFKKSEIDAGNAIYITAAGTNQFTLLPKYIYNKNGTDSYYEDVDLNWKDYKTLTFKVKVKSQNPVRFDGLMITIGENLWVSPAIKDLNAVGCTIPADGKVHTITLDLDRLYPFANVGATPYASDVLGCVFRNAFVFADTVGTGTELCFDDVTFGTEPLNFSNSDSSELNLFEKIKAFFVSLYTKILLFFQNLFK